jgi:hypothetical protein
VPVLNKSSHPEIVGQQRRGMMFRQAGRSRAGRLHQRHYRFFGSKPVFLFSRITAALTTAETPEPVTDQEKSAGVKFGQASVEA